MASSPEVYEANLGARGRFLLLIPAVVCFVGWVVQATVIYSTDTRLASVTALAFVGGSFAAIVPVVVLTTKIAKYASARTWPDYVVLSVSLLALVPALFVLTALAFRP